MVEVNCREEKRGGGALEPLINSNGYTDEQPHLPVAAESNPVMSPTQKLTDLLEIRPPDLASR